MEELYEKELEIAPGLCDAAGRLSLHETFGLFMDIAGAHADRLGIGVRALGAQGLFWLTVRTAVVFAARPKMGQTVVVRTWPQAPGKLRCERSYEICDGDHRLIAGKTEWAIMNTQTGAIVPADTIYPPGLRLDRPAALAEPIARVTDDFAAAEVYDEYRVRSTDIDVGGHMNNIAYVRALVGSFSNRELAALRPRRIDAIFRTPCYEGEVLKLQKKPLPEGLAVRMAGEKGTVFLARIETGQESY